MPPSRQLQNFQGKLEKRYKSADLHGQAKNKQDPQSCMSESGSCVIYADIKMLHTTIEHQETGKEKNLFHSSLNAIDFEP